MIFLRILIKGVVIGTLLACVILYCIRPTIINQMSMHPTCEPGDYILLRTQAYRNNEPERGDIIVFKSHEDEDIGFRKKLLIKRIIAIPGDHIVVKDGTVTLNGKILKEKYLPKGTLTNGSSDVTLPEDSYFVMGDNREVSLDSRYPEAGIVDRDDIFGKAFVRLFPFSSAGKIG